MPVDRVALTATGVRGDRELAIVGDDGALLDQVRWPKLARIGIDVLDDDRLVLSHPDAGILEHLPTESGEAVDVTVTLDQTHAIDQGDDVAQWLSTALDTTARLVRVGQPWTRSLPLSQFSLIDGGPADRFTSVAPILLNNQASLDDLNQRLDDPIPMNRFRMNVVVGSLPPFAEDEVSTLGGDEVTLTHMTACERCAIITTDQRSGQRPSGEVLRVLNDYRKKAEDRYTNGLVFGVYMAVTRPGELRVGERLAVARDPDFVPLVLPPRGLDAPD